MAVVLPVDSPRTNISAPVESSGINVAKWGRMVTWDPLWNSTRHIIAANKAARPSTDRDTSLRCLPYSHVGELSPCSSRVTSRPPPPMRREIGFPLPSQMPTAASIRKISAGDMSLHSSPMFLRIFFPITCHPVLSPA